jgi:hypothetical protein
LNKAQLCGLLTEALVRLTSNYWVWPKPQRTAEPGHPEPIQTRVGDLGYGQLLTTFTQAGLLLIELDLAELIEMRGRGSTWRYLVDGDKAADFTANRYHAGVLNLPSFERLAASFIECASHFDLLSTERAPFVAHDDIFRVVSGLAEHGFASQMDDNFSWRDPIGDAMRLGYFWNDANCPIANQSSSFS